jgi:hypothetical protein
MEMTHKTILAAAMLAMISEPAMADAETRARTMREARIYCEHASDDERESGALDEHLLTVEECARRILHDDVPVASASPAPLKEKYSCGDLVGQGLAHMPDITDYVLAKPGSSKLGLGSQCHIEDLVFSQCWLEPRLTVKQAIDLLIAKATAGKKLPDTPMCGA